jgi:multiple sugar transport system permease protein
MVMTSGTAKKLTANSSRGAQYEAEDGYAYERCHRILLERFIEERSDLLRDFLHAEELMVTGHGRLERAVRLWLPVGFFLVLALFPFYWMAITSLKPNAELYNKNIMPLIVHAPTLKHYVDLLTKTSFLLWTWNTMLIAIVATAISLVLGTMLAYPLARMRFAGASLIAMTVAAVYLVPQPLLFIPLADVINRLNLGNTLTSVILTYPTMLVPFCAWLLLGYFKTVPKELEEQALIDGASRWRAMTRVILPLCMPGFISAGIFAFTLAQNEFLYALLFLSRSSVRTVPIGVVGELIRGDAFYWGQLMAGALLGSVPVALIYSFFVKYYVAGLTAGAVKG